MAQWILKKGGQLLALAGLALAVWLFLWEHPESIMRLLWGAGAGLALAGLLHIAPMLLNARARQVIVPGQKRPGLAAMTRLIWLRDSINGLLPVARIGGEIVSYRLMRQLGMRRARAAASLVVDMTLAIISQFAFTLLGVAFLLAVTEADKLAEQLALGVVALVPVAAVFILVQRAGLFENVVRPLNRLAGGRLEGAIGHSVRIDRAVRTIYRRRRTVATCLSWQFAGWIAGAAEVWLALFFLRHPIGLVETVAIESLVQAVSSAAFVVPGALGVQEGAFLLAGVALGLDPPTALALAAARRLREIVVFFPGLVAWQIEEAGAAKVDTVQDARGQTG